MAKAVRREMATVRLTYNPYLLESTLFIDDKQITDGPLHQCIDKKRLDLWVETIVHKLAECVNIKEFIILFNGIPQDFEDLQKAAEHFNSTEKGQVRVEALPGLENNSPPNKLKALRSLVQKADSAPVEGIADINAVARIRQELDSDTFKIYVIATMSSGKSTLINALLGRDILPTANKATTANVVYITNDAKSKQFYGNATAPDGEPLEKENIQVDLKKMTAWNKEAKEIKIFGPMEINKQQAEQDKGMLNLVLVDTPGPNSAGTGHKFITYGTLEKETPPLILFILDATSQISEDMENSLLAIATQMKENGKRVNDRFLFVLNKIDCIDSQKEEPINATLDEHRDYLEKQGIIAPRIIPVSSLLPKLLRCSLAGDELSKDQKRDLNSLMEAFTDDDEKKLLQYIIAPKSGIRVPLSPTVAQRIRKRIADAEGNKKLNELAILHSGIPMLEETMWEYINKYGMTEKINNLKEKFEQEFKLQQSEKELFSRIQADEGKLQEINGNLKIISERLAAGEESQRFKEKLRTGTLAVTKLHKTRLEKVRNDYTEKVNNLVDRVPQKTLFKEEGEKFVIIIVDDAKNACITLKNAFQTMLHDLLHEQAEPILSEYLNYCEKLLEDLPSIAHIQQLFEHEIKLALPQIMRDAEYYVTTIRVKTGTREVSNVTWWKPWTWLSDPSYTPVYENRPALDMISITLDVQGRLRAHFEKSQTTLEEDSAAVFKEVIDSVITKMDEIDSAIQTYAKKMQEETKNKDTLEKALALKKEQMAWLTSFKQNIEACLSLQTGGANV